ncbi:hypothetical protein [Caulobacter hibisci]|uniref:Uncharacterized protein n=1 Tax=Caulobacter hibisci TaxID=2035993 RepID=A0ABS0SYV1_9CAUL|nr:hypothetical protein [Caulobacter hibisci]MBI1684436.1 hypothetical protein [Caulobacter hibisci]
MTKVHFTTSMTEQQAQDMQAALDGALDRMIAITGSLADISPGDQTLSAMGALIERLVLTTLQRMTALGEFSKTSTYGNVTTVAVHCAVSHLGAMGAAGKAFLAPIAARALANGINGAACDGGRHTDRRAH